MSSFHLVWTITLFVIFVGIVGWAWSSRRKDDFAEAERLPLENDQNSINSQDWNKDNG